MWQIGIEGTAIVSRVDYEYDSNGDGTQLEPRNDIGAGHFREYNPYLPPLQTCEQPDESGEIYCITVANYDPGTDYRGNVTKVTSWANAADPVDPLRETNVMKYDVAGNLVEATMNCCQLREWVYELSNKYAYPVEVKSGASGEFSQKAAYDYNTGLTTSTIDENNQPTEYRYEPDTLRAKKTIYPNGGYTENFYSDKEQAGSNLVPGYVRAKTTLETSKFAESYGYFDGRGLGIRSASQTPDGWSVSALEYDNLGRARKSYNPFYATTPNGTVPTGTKFTEVVNYDAFGRTTQVKLQDDTLVNSYPNEATATVTYPDATQITGTVSRAKDQADKERRQIVDALGRVIRVDEPTINGLGTVASPNQPTFYQYDGNDNLSKVIQSDGTVTQERRFKYDSMSRLTHEKQVEANPTLDINGVYGAIDANKWTKVLKYDAFGRLKEGIDARGVKTEFKIYDAVNRIKEIEFSDGTPKVTYTYDQARTGFHNSKALTRVETVPVAATPPGTMATATEFDYDLMGRVSKQRQTIGAETYNLEYGYNLAGQLTSQKYPSGKIVTTGYDANGRLASIADAQRTYLTGLQYQGKGNSMSSMALGNGTTETFTLNDRLQMSGQELKRGAETLQKYDYGFGELDSQGVLKNNGKLESVVSHIGTAKQWTQKFKYDEIGRLSETEEKRGDTNALSYKQNFDFDRFGNMYRKAAENPIAGQATPLLFTPIEETTTPGTGDIEKQTNRFRTETLYDDAGNVITDNKFRDSSFSYDANGRMIKATRANVPDALSVYDASGMRVAEKVNEVWRYLVYDIGGKLVAEYGGPPQTGDGGVKYVLQDWQGSTRSTLNNSGFVKSRTDYTAFGEDIGSGTGQRTSSQSFESTNSLRQKYGLTERDDATGLDHTWFRKNENQAGRWTSPDPYNGSMNLGNPQSFNRYSYVENDPTNFIDPSGLNRAAPRAGCVAIYRSGEQIGWNCPPISIPGGGRTTWDDPDPTSGGEEFPGGTTSSPTTSETCTLTVYISAVSLAGSSKSSSEQNNRENPPAGRVGVFNHLYLTYSDSSNGLTIGVRGGPVSVNQNESDYLRGSIGLYQKGGFTDFEINPKAAAIENYGKNCDELDGSFKKTISNLDKAKIKYSATGNNSNAFLYTLLNQAGINSDSLTPRINAVLGTLGTAPGWGTTVPIP